MLTSYTVCTAEIIKQINKYGAAFTMVFAKENLHFFLPSKGYRKRRLFCEILSHRRAISSTSHCIHPLVQFPAEFLVKRTFTEVCTYQNIHTRHTRTHKYDKDDYQTPGVTIIGYR